MEIFSGILEVDGLISKKAPVHHFSWCERWWTWSLFFGGQHFSDKFGLKNELQHWVGRGRSWDMMRIYENVQLRDLNLLSNEAVRMVSFHYKGMAGIPESLRVRSPIIISWSLMEDILQLKQWWNMRTAPVKVHHKKPTIRINLYLKLNCFLRWQVDFQQGSRAMSRYFQVYRTARSLTLAVFLFARDVLFWFILMMLFFLYNGDACNVFGPEFLLWDQQTKHHWLHQSTEVMYASSLNKSLDWILKGA